MMLDATKLTLFLITAFVILVTPGPAVLGVLKYLGGVFIALGVTLAVSGQSRK